MTSTIPAFASPGVLGHLSTFRHTPIDLLLRIARQHPEIARFRGGIFHPVVLTDPALVHQVLVEKADAFVKSYGLSLFARPLLGQGLLTLERDEHRKRRRLLAPSFMPRRIASYADEIAARAERSTARVATHSQLDMANESMRLTLEIVMKTLFNAELSNADDTVGSAFPRALSAMVDSITSPLPLPPPIPTPANLRLMRATRELDRVIYRVIAEKRASEQQRGDDMLSVLLGARDSDDGSSLDDRELRDEVMTMMLAGHETTANTLAWALYALARAPAARARLEAELDAIQAPRIGPQLTAALPWTTQVIKETMRLYPAVYMIARRCVRDVQLGSYSIERGAIIFINIVGMHRCPELYVNPEQFDPERWSPEREKQLPKHAYMPFSGGARVCIGNHFAMMEAQLVLATWLRNLRFDLLDPRQRIDIDGLFTLRPKGGVPLRITQRHAVSEAQARQPQLSASS